MGSYASMAHELSARGLVIIPVMLERSNDGKNIKRPITKWLERPLSVKFGARGLPTMVEKFGHAEIGLLTKPSGFTIVDVDDPSVADDMLVRFGQTPVVTRSPSGGSHYWYRSNGEPCRNLRDSEGIAVDIKGAGSGKGGLIVIPPSVRPDGERYQFIEGGWEYINALPTIKAGSLPDISCRQKTELTPEAEIAEAAISSDTIIGRRNKTLFTKLRDATMLCETYEQLHTEAVAINESFSKPLGQSEVMTTLGSVWKMHIEGRIWKKGHAGTIQLGVDDFHKLDGNGDASYLLMFLRLNHHSRIEFAVSPRGMAAAGVINGWSERRFRDARQVLIDLGFIKNVHQGGAHNHDASKFAFC